MSSLGSGAPRLVLLVWFKFLKGLIQVLSGLRVDASGAALSGGRERRLGIAMSLTVEGNHLLVELVSVEGDSSRYHRHSSSGTSVRGRITALSFSATWVRSLDLEAP